MDRARVAEDADEVAALEADEVADLEGAPEGRA